MGIMNALNQLEMVQSTKPIDPTEPKATLKIELPPEARDNQHLVIELTRLISKIRVSLVIDEPETPEKGKETIS